MIETRPLTGVIPVLQTPLHADGSIDTDGIGRHIDWLDTLDVGGYWSLGTGSEDMNLTFSKRLQVARAVTAANAGRKPLILGCGFFCMEDSLNFIEATKDLEFDAYHAMPYHPLIALSRLDWWYRALADATSKPLWMYTSANWCQHIPPSFVAGLVEHPNMAGIKFSSSNTKDQLAVLAHTSPAFQVITAVAKQFYPCLCMGAKAGTSSLGGAVPELLIAIYEAFAAGDHEGALAAQYRLTAYGADMPRGPKADNFLDGAVEKYIISKRGLFAPTMTNYYRQLTVEEERQVDACLEKHGIVI